MNTQKTQGGYVLHTDPITESQYLRIPITSINDLNYLQYSLLESLILLTRYEEDYKEIRHSIFWIAKILQAGYPNMELEQFDEF